MTLEQSRGRSCGRGSSGSPSRSSINRVTRRLRALPQTARVRIDPTTRAYLARKEAEGVSRVEAMRCLKRHLARHYHRLLLQPSTFGPIRT
ncbi:MAG TPA: hypothetical protein VK756_10715 [Solirubrobacteraceae bacterium]|nr:hypothetical protein [Solirubrobacteraceae bacterium]